MGIMHWRSENRARQAEEAAQRFREEQVRLTQGREQDEARRVADVATRERAAADEALRRAEEAKKQWAAEDAHLVAMIDLATTQSGAAEDTGLQLHAKERVFFRLTGAQLIEPRKERGTYVGGSPGRTIPGERPHYVAGYSGLSFRVAKGVRWNVGGSRGHLEGGSPSTHIPAVRATYVPGTETPTPIDSGTATITDQRVVFQGNKEAREWPFAKLLGYDNKGEWMSLQSSNRQKVSGIGYGTDVSDQWEFYLALSLAHFHGAVAAFVAHLQDELDAHRRTSLSPGELELPGSRSPQAQKLPTREPTDTTPSPSAPPPPGPEADQIPVPHPQVVGVGSPETMASRPDLAMASFRALWDAVTIDVGQAANSDIPADLERAMRTMTQADDELKEFKREAIDGRSKVALVALNPENEAALIESWQEVQVMIDKGRGVISTSLDQFSREVDRLNGVPTQDPQSSASPSPGSDSLPPPPPSPVDGLDKTPVPKPGWFPDPYYRHEVRYWTGTTWTPNVADHGQQATDPVQT